MFENGGTQALTGAWSATHREMPELVTSNLSPEDVWAFARRLSDTHAQSSRDSIVLYAGTNQASRAVETMLGSTMGAMPAMGRPWAKDQPGTASISALEALVERQLQILFNATWAEARVPSATLANLAVYRAFCNKDVPLMSTPGSNLGHASHLQNGTPSLLGIDVVAIPYERDGITVDEIAACELIERRRPGLLMLGSTLVLNGSYPERLIARARALGTAVAYDASHVAGLIAGRQMRNPFDAGVEIITASTYKSFGGPPGGIILGCDMAHAAALRPIVCPQLTSNYDATRLLALATACAEVRLYMQDYASRMVWSADHLYRSLKERGILMLDRPEGTGLHQILLPIGTHCAATRAMRCLEACHILAGTQRVPDQRLDIDSGLRFGTQVIARRRYDATALDLIAKLVFDVLTAGPSERVLRQSIDLARTFSGLYYCFDAQAPGGGESILQG
ncbi:hypothetical protein ACRS8P_01190 [Burkholderia cenocepacia]